MDAPRFFLHLADQQTMKLSEVQARQPKRLSEVLAAQGNSMTQTSNTGGDSAQRRNPPQLAAGATSQETMTILVTGPDGKRFRVTAPKGSTTDQAIAYVRDQYYPQEAAPLAEPGSTGAASTVEPSSRTGSQYTQEQLIAALRRADAAGDTKAAIAIARRIQALRNAPPPPRKSVEELTPGISTNPVDGMGWLDRFKAGAGKSVADTALGLAQAFPEYNLPALVASKLPGDPLGFAAGKDRLAQQAAEVAERDAPLMDTGAGLTGNLAGQVAQISMPVSGAANAASWGGRAAPYIAAATRGGAFSGAQPVMEGESREGNALEGAAWGAGGQGAATVVGRWAANAREQLAPAVRESIEHARKLGIPLNVAQVTNSSPIRAAQAVTKYLPFSGATKAAKAQQASFNRAVARTFGADASSLTDDVMRAARKRLSETFDDIYARNNVEITPDVVRRLVGIERDAFSGLTDDAAQVVRNQLNTIIREAGDGTLAGRKYQALRTALQRVELNGNPGVARFVKLLRSELDDAATRSVSGDDAANLAGVRGQWANLRTAEDALKQVAGAAGDIRPASLWALIRRGSTPEMRRLAKVGQNVLRETIGDSGTAQRNFWMAALGGASGGVGAATGTLPAIGQGVLAGALAGRALNSNLASKLLQQGRPASAVGKAAGLLPRLGPAANANGLLSFFDMDAEEPEGEALEASHGLLAVPKRRDAKREADGVR